MILGIAGVHLRATDAAATRHAYAALGVHGVTVDTGDPGLDHVVLAVEDRAAAVNLLRRRGADIDDDATADLGGLRWRLAGAVTPLTALDHVVVSTERLHRAGTAYGARLGLDLRLDRTFERFGFRAMWFRCGPGVVEVTTPLTPGTPPRHDDAWGGLAWRTDDVAAVRERLHDAGHECSPVRPGRKPGTVVVTVRDARFVVPTLIVGAA